MNFIKAYKFPLSITLGLIAVFFIFQNGTCSSGDTSTSSTAATATSSSTSPTISPSSVTLAAGGTQIFTVSGGSGNYSYSVIGGGTITQAGYYVAASSGSAEIQVYDATTGLYGYASVTVSTTTTTTTTTSTTATLTLTASSTSVSADGVVTLSVSGGTAPYSFLVLSGGGGFPSANSFSTSGATASYTAPSSTTGLVELEVTDVYSNVSNVVSLTIASTGTTGSTTSTTPSKIIAITSNSTYVSGDGKVVQSASHAIDGNLATFYSSTEYQTATPATMPYLEVTLGDANSKAGVFTVTHINITGRGASTGNVVAFPSSYVIKADIVGGNGWSVVGTFTTQPDFDGVARVTFSTPVITDKLAIVPVGLTKDPNNYYFQISEIGF